MSAAGPRTRSVTAVRPGPVFAVDGLLAPRYAQRLLEHWEAFPGYGLSSDGGTPRGRPVACAVAHRPTEAVCTEHRSNIRPPLLTALGQRADASANFVRTGGRSGSGNDTRVDLHARNNYFRATYVHGRDIWNPVVCRLLNHPVLADTARQLFGRPVVVPTQIYANVMLPGQELGLHTDVPQFRGISREQYPLWFLVVMQHSGLFDRWRVRLATAVLHLGRTHAAGGEFTYYPDGPQGASVSIPPRHNTALLLDTDDTLHGVDRVGEVDDAPRLRSGVRLRHADGLWRLVGGDPDQSATGWRSEQLRYSISWKAQCFSDAAERQLLAEHADDLTYEMIIDRLLAALPAGSAGLPPAQLGRRLIDAYIRFPT
ncbi:MAG: 2OG-Fe(II) oxygenase [Jatrophihabitans sp.]